MSASPVARIEQLEEIEKDVISILQTAGATLLEVAKDRPAQKTVDTHTQNVMADIKRVEQNLSEQIKYLTQVSTGHPHEGSSYPSQKVLQTAWHRLEHAKSRISELDNHRNRLGADMSRNPSNAIQKPGGSNTQQGSNNLKQTTATNSQSNSSAPTTAGSTSLKQELNEK